MAKLHFATFERILKESKKGIRVSDDATKEFIEVMERITKSIASEALELALHANRRTIMRNDIRLAARKWIEKV